MNAFLLIGLLRDRSRSLFPLIVVSSGVFITVLLHSWIKGAVNDIVDINSRFYTGHLKVMTRAYHEEIDQLPNDLALLQADSLQRSLGKQFPGTTWTPRIHFGGLLDIPDEKGETREQGPVTGMAVSLLHSQSGEVERLNLEQALQSGRLPQQRDEILISSDFAKKLKVKPGDTATLISSSMYGGMAIYNFTISGTVQFGINALDRNAIIADISGVRNALDMRNAAGELLGFFDESVYRESKAQSVAAQFNQRFAGSDDEFAPVMFTLQQQNDLDSMVMMVDNISTVVVTLFVLVMSIVLWNAGLLNSLRRYGEFGVRLAIGESRGHLYRTVIMEAIMIGLAGSIAGTLLGLAGACYLQVHGIDIGDMMSNSTILMSNVFRARITTASFYIGFFPGFLATTLGSMISGIGIYKRQTAHLFKELEV